MWKIGCFVALIALLVAPLTASTAAKSWFSLMEGYYSLPSIESVIWVFWCWQALRPAFRTGGSR
jgi:uncharacterized sodium:solute symporter family permease YidK